MVELKFLAAILLLSLNAFAKNGSSGVGTAAVKITDGVEASSLHGKIKAVGDTLVDAASNTPLISISDISSNEFLAAQATNHLFEAQLGSVKSYEYTPDFADKNGRNYWIVCDTAPDKCKKLTPLSNDTLISDVIGTLTYK